MTGALKKYPGDHGQRKKDRRENRCRGPQEIDDGRVRLRHGGNVGLDDIESSANRQNPFDVFPLSAAFQQFANHGDRDRTPAHHCTRKGRFNSLPVIEVSE